MKKALLPIAAVMGIAGLAGVAPAHAQMSPSSAFEAGRCIVSADRNAAAILMRTLPLDSRPADLSVLGRRRAASCVGGRVSSMLLRGAIAQELFLRDFRSFSADPRDPERLVEISLPVEGFGAPNGGGANELYRWSDCVVRNDTANTERLLQSGIGSSDEAQALTALQTYMSACLADGAQVRVGVSELRSLFAQSAYFSMYRHWTGQLATARNGGGA